MRHVALVSILCVALAGCGGGGVQTGRLDSGDADHFDAEGNVRAVIPAVEAYYADHGTYAGMTLARLRSTYDATLAGVRIVRAGARTYCVESTVGGTTASKHGPAADITLSGC
jgi:hypothetical protein